MALDKIKTNIIDDDAVTVAKMNTDTGVQSTHHKVPVYATNNARDSAIGSPAVGMIIYNTEAQALQQYNGTWIAIEPAPVITSISPTEVASAAGGTIAIVITGSNFKSSSMSVTFLANSGSDITSGITVTHTSSTSLTATLNKNSFVDANEPYDVKVQSPGGLAATLEDILRVDNAPSFSAAANTIVATLTEGDSNATHYTVAATDAESDAITFAEVGTTLLNKFTSATPRGVQSDGTIKGVPAAVSADETTSFTVRATSTGDGGSTTKTTDQVFRITINDIPLLFAGKAWAGSNSAQSFTFDEAADLQPDFVWIKGRDNSPATHRLYDSIRGATKYLESNTVTAEQTAGLSAFNTDGFSLAGSDGGTNYAGRNYVGWGWKAGGAPSADNKKKVNGTESNISQGTDFSTSISAMRQSVNSAADFSITKYTGNSNTASGWFKHGLSGIPDFVIVKSISAGNNWMVWHSGLGTDWTVQTNYLNLDGDDARGYYNGSFNGQLIWDTNGITSDKIHLKGGAGLDLVIDDANYICYAWKAKAGVSKFGTYTGSGDTNQTLTTGFLPRFVMTKNTDNGASGASWEIKNAFSNTSNPRTEGIHADESGVGSNEAAYGMDFISTGFEIKGNSNHMNKSGDPFIYIAFA